MQKAIKYYAVLWGIAFILFQVTAFLVPFDRESGFWIGYLFIDLAFVGQLFCGWFALREENAQKTFYRFPLLRISYIGVLAMLVAGGLTMAIPGVPVWIGSVVCLLILGFTAMAVVCAAAAGETVSKIDQQTAHRTRYIRLLTADAEVLMQQASADSRETAKRVYEAIRYSDPTSNEALAPLEALITAKFEAFCGAIKENNVDSDKLAEELLLLLADRNTKCRLLK